MNGRRQEELDEARDAAAELQDTVTVNKEQIGRLTLAMERVIGILTDEADVFGRTSAAEGIAENALSEYGDVSLARECERRDKEEQERKDKRNGKG